jgi:hypothetical protein
VPNLSLIAGLSRNTFGAFGYLGSDGKVNGGQLNGGAMAAPSGGWESLTLDGSGDRLSGHGFVVRGRTQGREDELWLNVKLPDGSWSYLVIRDGEVVASECDESKRMAYQRAVEAVACLNPVR